MHDVHPFGLLVLGIGLAAAVAVLSNRITERTRVPAPLLFLIGAAVASNIDNDLAALSMTTVQRVVTVALVLILFDGGMHIGWRRFRASSGSILLVGVLGTLLTAGALGLSAHLLFDLDWRTSLLLGTALAPTDPAVVFSVLGRREISGRSGTVLEGESGANDPVGIALLAALLLSSGGGLHAASEVAREFVLQMAVGTAIGVAGGIALLHSMRRIPLPSEALYPLRTLAEALAIYGLATVAHGSGFLAAFIAGIIAGDAHAPYKGEIRRFHSSLASLGEIVAFTLLGLTVDLTSLLDNNAWLLGLCLAALLTFVVRPLFIGPLLLRTDLNRGERLLILWAGLKGAVPILLGSYLVTAHVHQSQRLYDAVIVAVAFSVLLQGSLVPAVAERLGVPMREIAPEPWALAIRFRDEPQGLRRHVVAAGSPADSTRIADLDLDENTWISLVIRGGQLIPISGDTQLQPQDEVVLLTDEEAGDPAALFAPLARPPNVA
jgi:cell volume regulation protein A